MKLLLQCALPLPPSLSLFLSLLHCSLIDDNILEFLLVFLRSSLSCRLISHSHSLQQKRVKQAVGRGRGAGHWLAKGNTAVWRVGNQLNNETFARYWNRIAARSSVAVAQSSSAIPIPIPMWLWLVQHIVQDFRELKTAKNRV